MANSSFVHELGPCNSWVESNSAPIHVLSTPGATHCNTELACHAPWHVLPTQVLNYCTQAATVFQSSRIRTQTSHVAEVGVM